NRCACITLVVQNEVAIIAPRGEQAFFETGAFNALQPFGWNDLVGVDIGALQWNAATSNDADGFHAKSPGVAKWPATAVAAATSGETR
ncbi:MAG: hypothetical protein RLZ02_275, partial [Actinomycetota bacterium]